MNEISTWVQNNWYELGTLLCQLAFFVGAIWFGKKILTTLRASQEQVGALLKLSVTAGTGERQSSPAIVEKSPETNQFWMTPSETQAVSETLMNATAPKLEVSGPGPLHGVVNWLKTPMSSGGHHPLRRAKNWLQSSAGS